jgi:hypothetical protein
LGNPAKKRGADLVLDPIVIKLFEVVWLEEIGLLAFNIGLDLTMGLIGFGVLVAVTMVISGFIKWAWIKLH